MDVVHRQPIRRPADEVFAFVADFANNPAWQGGMTSCTWDSDARGVGATYRQEARFLGRTILTTFRVTEREPGCRISIESLQSTFPIQVTRTVAPTADGCVVTAHVRGQPTGLLKLMSGLAARSIRKDYAALQRLLEARTAPH